MQVYGKGHQMLGVGGVVYATTVHWCLASVVLKALTAAIGVTAPPMMMGGIATFA